MKRTDKAGETRPDPGDSILMTGFAGDAGAMILAERLRETLLKRFSSEFLSGIGGIKGESPEQEVLVILSGLPGVSGITALGEGGFYKGLWDFIGKTGSGVRVRLNDVPIRQETVELCEFLNGNPYRLFSKGSFLAAVRKPEDALEILLKAGIPAETVGTVVKAPEKTVIRGGEPFFLERPKKDFLKEALLLKTETL